MIAIDGKYIEQITKANVNNLIIVDYFADANYQDDGAVDFMLLETVELTEMMMALMEADTIDYFDTYDAYVTVESDGTVKEIEFIFKPYEDECPWSEYYYELNAEEQAVVLARIEDEVKDKFHMTLDDMLREAKGE